MTALPTLIIGEVLFDRFPDGQRVLGGAPFNVAWNLQGFGLAPTFVSAVGDDSEGRVVRKRMDTWEMDTQGLQVVADKPTGAVRVTLKAGQPSYQILDHQAYDNICVPDFPVTPAKYSMLYLGSLAFRHNTSRRTIQHLISSSGLPRFVDINIRQPWFDRAWLPELLGGATWVKLNDEELSWMVDFECRSDESIVRGVEVLRRTYQSKWHFITSGAVGAYAFDPAGRVAFAEPPQPKPMTDTVGAGDAFSAAIIQGIRQQRPLDQILASAVRFASRVCTLRGATSSDRNHYAGWEV